MACIIAFDRVRNYPTDIEPIVLTITYRIFFQLVSISPSGIWKYLDNLWFLKIYIVVDMCRTWESTRHIFILRYKFVSMYVVALFVK